ncbi:MAG: isoleucine--tRNA ligase [candidate division WOR-3 bacterium]
MEIRDTLNLPKTDFSMKANLSKREKEIIEYWDKERIYYELLERKNKGIFILHDGPPYSNEHIHLGTAINKILKDIIVKFYFINGYKSPYIPGWDNHGMPIENKVIQENEELYELVKDPENLKKPEIKRIIREKSREYARKWTEVQKEEFKRLLCIGEWDNPYLTMDPKYEAEELRLFAELIRKGYIYRSFMPVHFCSYCHTPLAMAEIEYKDKESPSIYFTMNFKKGQNFPFDENTEVLIWTTTPWTIISNLALAFNPDFYYLEIEVNGRKFILAEPTLERVKEELSFKDIKILKREKGEIFENKEFLHPFFERISKGILADFVTELVGSGVVHIAPGHGKEDFEVGVKYNLPILSPIDDSGRFTHEAGEIFKGLSVEEASLKVIEILKEKNKLLKYSKIIHSYPHCWRCKNPLIFKATSQWFLSLEHLDLRKRALSEIEKIKWVPESSINRITAAVAERPDWCISRQRAWGVFIPALRCKRCSNVFLNAQVIERLSEKVEKETCDAWLNHDLSEFLTQDIRCEKCNSREFEKEFDILDVWIDSGLTSLIVLKERNLPWPSDVYIEGPDQHRGWFNASLVLSMALREKSPYKICITHGWTLDAEGRAMHKSLGNVIDPIEVCNKYGAEILRIWAASSEYTQDVRLSDEILNRNVEIYRKIRNTFRFILGNIYDFDPEKDKVHFEKMLPFDKYILSLLKIKREEWIKNYKNFEFHKFFKDYYTFCSDTLSSFYLDALKDRLYVSYSKGIERRSAQTALYIILKELLIFGSPILSFTCEEAYLKIPGKKEKSIFFEEIKDYDFYDEEIFNDFEKIKNIRDVVLKALENVRQKGIIGSSLEANLYFDGEIDILLKYKEYLKEIFIVSDVFFEKPSNFEENLYDENLKIEVFVKRAKGSKCIRCWMYSENLKKDEDFDALCPRCYEIIKKIRGESE